MPLSSKFKSVTCIVIAYNEEASIGAAIEEVLCELGKFGFERVEIIVVDDGSTDGSVEIARASALGNPQIRVIVHERNLGPGSGIITGIKNASGDIVCFHAADRQLDFAEVCSFIPMLDDYDLLIGERNERPGYTIMRRIVSKMGIWVAKLFFGLDYRDYYFLYLYRRSVFKDMMFKCGGIFVVVEILVKAIDRGLKIGRIKAGCFPRRHGKATCGRPKIILRTLKEALSLWFSYRVLGKRN